MHRSLGRSRVQAREQNSSPLRNLHEQSPRAYVCETARRVLWVGNKVAISLDLVTSTAEQTRPTTNPVTRSRGIEDAQQGRLMTSIPPLQAACRPQKAATPTL
jgi:hypothetical protein